MNRAADCPQAPGASVAKDLLDITVLMGGPSAEREVSLMSGEAIADALQCRGHKITRADILPADLSALDREGVDVVFIALHGAFGESGEVQRLCEQRGLAYTGSPPRASELAMDKAAAKQIMKRVGLATPDWMIIEEYHRPSQVAEWLDELGLPVVLKPVDGGSSVGITIAHTAAQREGAMASLLDEHGRAMLERFVAGRELTVGILGDEALPLLEVRPAREFYDYQAKYADDAGTEYTFDHGLEQSTVEAVGAAAQTAHRALGCRDMSRVDFLLDEQGTGWVLEVNTIPGFTSHSLLPMAAAKAGIEFQELVDRIARMALAR
jgi:D-alanine-D-alanine ligase